MIFSFLFALQYAAYWMCEQSPDGHILVKYDTVFITFAIYEHSVGIFLLYSQRG